MTKEQSLQLKNWLDFLIVKTKFEIKARYKHALLGFLWVLLNPLLQMTIIGVIFSHFIPTQVENYFLFLFLGLLPWMFFSSSLQNSTTSVLANRLIIQKAKFPRETIVLSVVLSHFFHYLISILLLFVVLLITSFSFKLLLSSIFIVLATSIWILIFTTGVSLFFAAAYVRYRDMSYVVTALLQLWFYATPIIYQPTLLPKNLLPFFFLNPMAGIVETLRLIGTSNQQATDFKLVAISVVSTIVISAIGYYFFEKEKKYFDDWI